MRWKSRFVLWACLRLMSGEAASSVIQELPIEPRDGLLWVEVAAPGAARPLNFLLDSGASVSVVSLDVARGMGLRLGSPRRVAGVRASLKGYWPVTLALSAPPIQLPDQYLALDLRKLSSACSRPVDGLIGAEFFRGRIVQIDYGARKLRLLKGSPPDTRSAIPLETRECGFRVPVTVNAGTQWVRLDTGCVSALQWVTSKENLSARTLKPAVGLAELSIPQTTTTVQIGDCRFDDVPTGLHAKAIFPGESGLLGNGLLSRFGVITIDARAGRLVLGPVD
jgi:hypothetical protein